MKAKQALRELNVTPRRERGQNFLIRDEILDEISRFGNPKPDNTLVEIGPGLGALTEQLHRVAPLTVIEIERNFCDELQRKFPDISVIHADVRKVDLSTLGDDLVVFGNIPYVYSTDIIFHLLAYRQSINRAILLLQREFAERVAADPGGRSYGVLSVMAQNQALPRLGPIISGDSFRPPTKVESRLLELTMREEPLVPQAEHDWFYKVVRAAFLKKRKMIHNSLKASGLFSGEQVTAALQSTGIEASRRAETTSIAELLSLSRSLRGEGADL